MKAEFAVLAHIPLVPGAGYRRPAQAFRNTPLDAPATEVMTDLGKNFAVTTTPGTSIDEALEHMKRFGVRLLLVIGENDDVIGLITANDILGEKPVNLVRDTGLTRAELTVDQLMTAQSAIEVLNLSAVRNAQVGHIVQTLHAMERQHALVVEVDRSSGTQEVCGIFSTSEIGKRVGYDVTEVMTSAHSLAEIHHELGAAG